MKSRQRDRLILLTMLGIGLGFALISMVELAVSEPPAPLKTEAQIRLSAMRRICIESPTVFSAWGIACFSSPVDELTDISWRSLEIRM